MRCGHAGETRGIEGDRFYGMGFVMFRPGADVREQDNPEKSQKRKPRQTRLSLGKNESGEERTERGAGVTTDLEKRLRHTVLPAGSHARDAGRFRVEHGRANAHEGG